MEDKYSVFSLTENLESVASKWVGPMKEKGGSWGRSLREGPGKVRAKYLLCQREDIIMKPVVLYGDDNCGEAWGQLSW